MASSYCKVSFNWESECEGHLAQERATNAIKYSFVDVDSSDFSDLSFENRINSQDNISLLFHKREKDETFEINISSNSPEFSQIDGLSIHSESKTLEISNVSEGYIKTVKGRKLPVDDADHFVCTSSFEKPYSSLSVKLLSLGNRNSVCIRSLTVNIRQHNLDHASSNSNSTFDMNRLKKDIEDMGDSVSDRALDFLSTMETFEKNKMSSFGNLLGQNAMMSMTSPAAPNGISSLMRSVLGDNAMNNLEKDVASKDGEEAKTEQGSIYSMLQAMCGKVAAARPPSKHSKDDPSSEVSVSENTSSNSVKPVNGQNQLGINTSSFVLDILNQRLEEAKQDMREEIQVVKAEVTNHIDEVKKEIMGQLNTITVLLQGLQPNSGHSHCVQDE